MEERCQTRNTEPLQGVVVVVVGGGGGGGDTADVMAMVSAAAGGGNGDERQACLELLEDMPSKNTSPENNILSAS
ncbi:Hypothetical predicted protein [Octopus vulgaris]|uniref:Uncharacterized protein n=1 Tax=Octopus vulgaris TaxID=6645 RepID=A0AA36FGM8_OCTVU|nr:Hypothetical predicted protein [Octopus vulgaris]